MYKFFKILLLIVFFLLIPLQSLKSMVWTQSTEDDFNSGTSSNVVVDAGSVHIKNGIVTVEDAFLPTPREAISAAYCPADNKVYIFGGHYCDSGTGYYYSDIIEYDAATCFVVKKSETLLKAKFGTSAVYNPFVNKIYVFGGSGSGYFPDIIEYDPVTGSVMKKNQVLPTGRGYTSAVYNSSNGKIYIFGGTSSEGYLSDIISYDPETEIILKMKEKLPSARIGASAVYNPLNNRIYIFGGRGNEGYLSSITEYNPETGDIAESPHVLPSVRGFTASAYNYSNNKIYILGGRGSDAGSFLSDIIEYDPVTGNVVKKEESLPTARCGACCIFNTSDKRIYVFGGYEKSGGSHLAEIIKYGPEDFLSSGYYISPLKNLGGIASFGKISWQESLPSGTDITLQTRNSLYSNWSSSYTTPSGEEIVSLSARYIQLKANLSTSISGNTPVLYNFTLTYNCRPSAPSGSLLNSGNSSLWVSKPAFLWTFYDIDSDIQSSFQIQLRRSAGTFGDGSSKDSGIIDSLKSIWAPEDWDLVHKDSYCWRVRVKDNSGFDNAWSPWSNEAVFYVDLSSPAGKPAVPLDEGETSVFNALKFKWTAGSLNDPESGIAGYYLQVSTSPCEPCSCKFNGAVGNCMEYTVFNCEDRKTYFARVRGVNGSGLFSEWSGWSDGITIWSAVPVVSDEITVTVNSGKEGLSDNDALSIKGDAEPGATCEIVLKDQKGRILTEGIELSNTEIGNDGKINASVFLGKITKNYPLADKIKIEVSLIDPEGHISDVSVSEVEIIPDEYEVKLYDNVINPLRTKKPVSIKIDLKESHKLYIKIYNKEGALIKKVADGVNNNTGVHVYEWWGRNENGEAVESGLYFVQIKTGSFLRNLKAVVIK